MRIILYIYMYTYIYIYMCVRVRFSFLPNQKQHVELLDRSNCLLRPGFDALLDGCNSAPKQPWFLVSPLQIPTQNGFSWFQSGANGFRPSTVGLPLGQLTDGRNPVQKHLPPFHLFAQHLGFCPKAAVVECCLGSFTVCILTPKRIDRLTCCSIFLWHIVIGPKNESPLTAAPFYLGQWRLSTLQELSCFPEFGHSEGLKC